MTILAKGFGFVWLVTKGSETCSVVLCFTGQLAIIIGVSTEPLKLLNYYILVEMNR